MAVDSLLDYGLTVPDLEVGRRFYETFGLNGERRGNGLAFRCEGRDQDQVLLFEGRRKRLHHLCFGADQPGQADVRGQLAKRGIREIDPPAAACGDGLWFADPDGHPIGVRVGSAKPWRTAPPVVFNTPGHYSRVGLCGCPAAHEAKPHRLGHVLLHTPRLDEMAAFYSDTLGMRVSDWVQGIVTFLHLPGGGDHHTIALLASDRPGFHHASFEVGSPDEIGLGAKQVLAAGYRDGWGLGRHVLGSNFFYYVRDPWDSLAEYFCDIDQIPPDGSWQAHCHLPEDAFYRWGPPPPEDFGANFEVPE